MNLTKADAAMLGRRAQQPTKAPGELLAVFVAGKLKNPLNGPQWGKQKFSQMRYRREWKERVAQATLEAGVRGGRGLYRHTEPKRVTFLACTHNAMDDDGLEAALKPVRDALVECGVLHSDGPSSGHEFVYEQRIDRKRRGVEIRVRLRSEVLASDAGAPGIHPKGGTP